MTPSSLEMAGTNFTTSTPPVGRKAALGPDIPTAAVEAVEYLLQWQEWDQLLSNHPNQRPRSYLVEGINEGFRIEFSGEAKGPSRGGR